MTVGELDEQDPQELDQGGIQSEACWRTRTSEVQGRAETIFESKAQETPRTVGLFSKENPCPFATLPGTLEEAEEARSLGARCKALPKCKEAREAEDLADTTEGESAVRRLFKRRQTVAEEHMILDRIVGEMHTSEAQPMTANTSASSSNEPVTSGVSTHTLHVPETDAISAYRARVEETMRNAGLQGWRARLAESQSIRLRNRYWPHLPLGVAGFGQARDATEVDAERTAIGRSQTTGQGGEHPTQP